GVANQVRQPAGRRSDRHLSRPPRISGDLNFVCEPFQFCHGVRPQCRNRPVPPACQRYEWYKVGPQQSAPSKRADERRRQPHHERREKEEGEYGGESAVRDLEDADRLASLGGVAQHGDSIGRSEVVKRVEERAESRESRGYGPGVDRISNKLNRARSRG